MNKTAKIVVTICIVVVLVMLYALVSGMMEASSHIHITRGFLGIIFFAAVYGAIRAVWKSGKKNDNNSDTSMLQK